MTVALILLALVLAGIIGWLVRQSLDVKPWQATPGGTTLVQLPARAVNARRIGLAALVGSIGSFFALFMSAYLMRMHYADWVSVEKPGLLWANTGVLLLGSVFLHRASDSANRGDATGARNGLLLGGALTVLFMAGQAVVWLDLWRSGYHLATGPASAFFYLVTILHLLHLIGGMIAWAGPTVRVFCGVRLALVRTRIELCAWYWHALLVIWLVLFAVLLAT